MRRLFLKHRCRECREWDVGIVSSDLLWKIRQKGFFFVANTQICIILELNCTWLRELQFQTLWSKVSISDTSLFRQSLTCAWDVCMAAMWYVHRVICIAINVCGLLHVTGVFYTPYGLCRTNGIGYRKHSFVSPQRLWVRNLSMYRR